MSFIRVILQQFIFLLYFRTYRMVCNHQNVSINLVEDTVHLSHLSKVYLFMDNPSLCPGKFGPLSLGKGGCYASYIDTLIVIENNLI